MRCWLKIKNKVYFLVKLILTLCFFVHLFGIIKRNYKRANQRFKYSVLNHNTPGSYKDLFKAERNPGQKNKKIVKKYLDYHEKIVKYMPKMSDAHGLLGYSHYAIGENDKAIDSYQKALSLNPYFFGFNYNLGVIYYKNKKYLKAIVSLESALRMNRKKSLNFILSSRFLYLPMVGASGYKSEQLYMWQSEGYRNAYLLLILSYKELEDYVGMRNMVNRTFKNNLTNKETYFYFNGLASYYLKDYKEALFFLRKAIKVNPDLFEPYHYAGLSLRELKRKKSSVWFLSRAVTLFETKNLRLINDKSLGLKPF